MKLEFIKFDAANLEHCEAIARWENDPEIRFLLTWHPNEESTYKIKTVEMVQARANTRPPPGTIGERFMMIADNKLIGDVYYCLGAPQAFNKGPNVAWLGIGIGEKEYRGRGIGKTAMAFIEEQAKNAGATLIELGVFEFNAPALQLYKKLGYTEASRSPAFTWYQGKMWDDIRMTKVL